jgi:hypothetical protein
MYFRINRKYQHRNVVYVTSIIYFLSYKDVIRMVMSNKMYSEILKHFQEDK